MFNSTSPRIEHIGTVTVGASHYWLQRYYPNGGDRYVVYVFNRRQLGERGVVFKSEDAVFDWLETRPAQLPLF